MTIELYYAPIACSLVPYVTLTEAGADFTVHSINMRKGEHKSPDYLKLNPKHKVPLLVIDGKTLSENVAIQQWIDMTYPNANLLPKDPWQRLQAVSLLAWCASGIHPYLSRINSPLAVCDVPGSEDSVKRNAAEHLFETYGIADEMLAGRDYFFHHFTAAAFLLVCPARHFVQSRSVAIYKLHGAFRADEAAAKRAETAGL